ncbi:MAG: hypothetical protein PW789_17995 [Edaphobacter sp.]|uniref:hypothetical protein n=1 Tax=Edaphobacter sp. TaxID=1934404 RepID=UPI0023903DF5|nr:hypothetical protein [Edaphobacter sp.]MDE1178469.1 hypothetical protein [Edaphobacter sp.]
MKKNQSHSRVVQWLFSRIADVIVPEVFTNYQVQNTLVSTALFESGVTVENGEMKSQLQAGAESFAVAYWLDPAAGAEADVTNDDPTILSTPQKIGAGKQVVRKSFLHASWGEMSLASELSGSDALVRIQDRVQAYWDQQLQKRLIATLRGVLYSNVANNASDMVVDISAASGDAASFNGSAVVDTALTLGDRLGDVKAIAMHSAIYGQALKANEITFFKLSENSIELPTYKGMAVIIDDSLSPVAGVYTTILMGQGARWFCHFSASRWLWNRD